MDFRESGVEASVEKVLTVPVRESTIRPAIKI
jgi:hypothetical protein